MPCPRCGYVASCVFLRRRERDDREEACSDGRQAKREPNQRRGAIHRCWRNSERVLPMVCSPSLSRAGTDYVALMQWPELGRSSLRQKGNRARPYDVAKTLGDTIETSEKHYTPFVKELRERVCTILESKADWKKLPSHLCHNNPHEFSKRLILKMFKTSGPI